MNVHPIWRHLRWRPYPAMSASLLLALLVLLSPVSQGSARALPAHPGYDPVQLAHAYDVLPVLQRGIRGQGQTIAFMEVDGIDTRDLAHFDAVFGLPAASLTVYIPADATQPLDPGPETTMDVEYAHALAPAARLQVYEITKSGDFANYSTHLADAVRAAIDRGATIISMSLRGTGSILCSELWSAMHLHGALQDAASHGIAIFVASGDYGYRPCQLHNSVHAVYPAADSAVTAVGGTRLQVTSNSSYGMETAWTGSGGGFSSVFKRPSWQQGPGVYGTHRGVPDVAFDADPHTGVLVYLQGHWLLEGGTSLGAPCWSAIWALASDYHQQRTGRRLGWANSFLYGLANSSRRSAVFHDVTTGDNGYYHAGPGWDPVTGWGSPDVARLVTALTP